MSATLRAVQPTTEHQAPPPDLLTTDELAPVLVAKAEFDETQAKLTRVREVLRRAKQLGSMNLHAERDVSRDAAAQLLGEKLDGPLGSPPKRTVSEEDKLMSAALPALEQRERELSQELLQARGWLRSKVCHALESAIKRRIVDYIATVDVLRVQLAELLALDTRLCSFTGKYILDPVGNIKLRTQVAALPKELMPKNAVVTQAWSVDYLLHAGSLDAVVAAAAAKVYAQLSTHVSLDSLVSNSA